MAWAIRKTLAKFFTEIPTEIVQWMYAHCIGLNPITPSKSDPGNNLISEKGKYDESAVLCNL